jgi:hypothetical protein
VFYSLSLHSPHSPYQTAAFRVTPQPIEYCFRKAGYGRGQLSGVSDVVMKNEDLATSGVNTVEELCESHVVATLSEGSEEEGEDTKPEVVPNFAEAHEALLKVKSFVYAHSNSDGYRDSV